VNRVLAIGIALVACTVAGGLAGGLLSVYWWDFPPEDMELWRTETTILYAGLGAIGGILIGGMAVALTCVAIDARRARPS
jgi:hypothetical protein